MSNTDRMKRLCDSYIRHVAIIGALYCVIPTLLWFLGALIVGSFREIYVLRLVLSLGLGGGLAAYLNRFGLSLWLAKHRSQEGPGTVMDGAVIGAAAGLGTALVPPLSGLILSSDFEFAQSLIICVWLIAMVVGTIIGGALATIGRKYIERTGPSETGSAADS